MKFIPIGLQCSVPEGLKNAGLRTCSYALDWLWSPSKTSLSILSLLFTDGINATVDYMTTNYKYYIYLGNEHYIPSDKITESQMNSNTGLGITHFTINDEYKIKLAERLERIRTDILSNETITLIYADAANPQLNYHINDICYGLPATDDLIQLYELLYKYNKNINILYFCWNEHVENNSILTYISYDYQPHWIDVANIITKYMIYKYGEQNNIILNEITHEIIFD